MENPYHVLGLSNLATDKEIQARYRKLAFKFHPDRNPEQREEAERNFKRVKEAYDLLRQRKENQFERTEYRSGTSSRSSYRQDSRKTQTRNAYYTGQHYSGFSRTSNRSTRYHSGSCILSEGSSFSSRPPRMLDIHGLQILVFTLVASTSIAVLFGDSWWKKLNRGKSFEDMMKQRRILRSNRVRLEQED